VPKMDGRRKGEIPIRATVAAEGSTESGSCAPESAVPGPVRRVSFEDDTPESVSPAAASKVREGAPESATATGNPSVRARYLQRLKLQKALVRLMEVLQANESRDIPPDRRTAKMAQAVVGVLQRSIDASGLQGQSPAQDRFDHLANVKKRETRSRDMRRLAKQIREME
jgi:hypothetical protein